MQNSTESHGTNNKKYMYNNKCTCAAYSDYLKCLFLFKMLSV